MRLTPETRLAELDIVRVHRMSDHEFIAERVLKAVSPDGTGFNIHMKLGKPYQISEDEWACPVALEGLYKDLVDQHGIDSWQALQLSSQLIVNMLCNFIETGGKLFLQNSEEEITPGELQKYF